jgi:hypothetical protein
MDTLNLIMRELDFFSYFFQYIDIEKNFNILAACITLEILDELFKKEKILG